MRWRALAALLLSTLQACTALQQRASGPIELQLCGNYSSLYMYTLVVEAGTPAVQFDVSFDTGSTALMIPDIACDSCVPGRQGALYNASASSSERRIACPSSTFTCTNCSALGQCTTQIRYVGITEDAYVAQDRIALASGVSSTASASASLLVDTAFGAILNITMSPMQAKLLAPGVRRAHRAQHEEDDFVYPAGVIGFGKKQLSPFGGSSIFDSMVHQRGVRDVFSFCLNSWLVNQAVGGGLTLGAPGNAYSQLPIAYTPLVRQDTGYYELQLLDVLVDNESLALPPSRYNTPHSIVDTGTPTLSFNQAVYKKLVGVIRSQCATRKMIGACGIPIEQSIFNGKSCFSMLPNEISQWPTISLVFEEGVTLYYPPTQYLIPLWYCNFNAHGISSPVQRVGFAVQGDPSNFGTVIGATVLQGYATTIDRSAHRAGFAPVQSCPKPNNCPM